MKYTLKRRDDFSVQKKYSRKGKLNEKKNHARQLTLHIFMLWPKKIRTGNLITKKIPAARKFPTPSHNFSNGPSLRKQKGVIVPGVPSGVRGNWD